MQTTEAQREKVLAAMRYLNHEYQLALYKFMRTIGTASSIGDYLFKGNYHPLSRLLLIADTLGLTLQELYGVQSLPPGRVEVLKQRIRNGGWLLRSKR